MRLWIGAFSLIWAVGATAAPAPNAPLTLGRAIALVLDNNPQLQAADFNAKAAAARIRQQMQGTPWQVGASLENFGGTGQADGIDQLESTLSLGRVLELGNKPALRGEIATLQAGLLRHQQDAQRLDLLAEAATRFLSIARAQQTRELAADQVTVMQRTLRAVQRRANAGKASAAEIGRAQIGLARAELASEESEHLLAIGRRQLAAMWGEFQPNFTTVKADLYRLSPDPDFATLEKALERNPALIRLATVERLADARRRLARAARRPDLDVAAGVRHYNATNDVGLTLSVRVPLGTRERAQPYEDEARELAAREPLLARDQRLALRSTLYGLFQELKHDRDRFNAMQNRVLPAAEKSLAGFSRGYAAGRYSLLEFTQSQETLLQARLELLDAAADHHETLIQIERLIGSELSYGMGQ